MRYKGIRAEEVVRNDLPRSIEELESEDDSLASPEMNANAVPENQMRVTRPYSPNNNNNNNNNRVTAVEEAATGGNTENALSRSMEALMARDDSFSKQALKFRLWREKYEREHCHYDVFRNHNVMPPAIWARQRQAKNEEKGCVPNCNPQSCKTTGKTTEQQNG